MADVQPIPRPYWRFRYGVPIMSLICLGSLAYDRHVHAQPVFPPILGVPWTTLLGGWIGFLLAPLFVATCLVVLYNLLVALFIGVAQVCIWLARGPKSRRQ